MYTCKRIYLRTFVTLTHAYTPTHLYYTHTCIYTGG